MSLILMSIHRAMIVLNYDIKDLLMFFFIPYPIVEVRSQYDNVLRTSLIRCVADTNEEEYPLEQIYTLIETMLPFAAAGKDDIEDGDNDDPPALLEL